MHAGRATFATRLATGRDVLVDNVLVGGRLLPRLVEDLAHGQHEGVTHRLLHVCLDHLYSARHIDSCWLLLVTHLAAPCARLNDRLRLGWFGYHPTAR
eukprot:scaffold60586_cov61-Phaeocystis_antarctica.AAC.2